VGGIRDVDTSWFSKALQSGGNVHSVPEQIAASDHHIANMDADPKFETALLRDVVVSLRKRVLYLYGALDSIYGTWELGQDTVACRIGDPPAMRRDQPVHDLAMGCQGVERSDLVLAHQARITCHIRCEDRGKPSLDPVLLAIHGTLGAVPERIVLLTA
jgi:hypothetical protein